MSFDRNESVVEMPNGDKWISIPALLSVLADINGQVQVLADQEGTVKAYSVAGVVNEFVTELRLTLMTL